MLDGAMAARAAGHDDTAVLSFVTAAIHAADALCIYSLGEYAQGDDHTQGVALLARVPDGSRLAGHLRTALSAKKRLTYDVVSVKSSDLTRLERAARALVEEAERPR